MKTICVLLLVAFIAAEEITHGHDCNHREERLQKFREFRRGKPFRRVEGLVSDWEKEESIKSREADEVKDMCKDKPNGDYQHPSECSKYVTCSNAMEYVMKCPENLVFNPTIDKCDYKENTKCQVPVTDRAEFQAKGKHPAVIHLDLTKFDGDMKITQVKLEHVSGSVTCTAGVTPSFWGCNNRAPATYTSEVIGVLITDNNDKKLIEQTKIPGYTGNSPFIVFNTFRNQVSKMPIMIKDLPQGILKVWYNEDFTGQSTGDDKGTHVFRMYLTVVE